MTTRPFFNFSIKNGYRSFTLVEMLIVIVIIGILIIPLVSKVRGIQDKAKITSAHSELRQIGMIMFSAQQNNNSTMKDITGNICTYCSNATHDYVNRILYLGKNATSWKNSLGNISIAAGNTSSLDRFYTDPWGYPYVFDENEGESFGGGCRTDILMSVGLDGAATISGVFYWDIVEHPLDKDNIKYDLRPLFCSGSY